MKTKAWTRVLTTIMLAVVVLGLMGGVASAAEPTPTTTTASPDKQQRSHERLERLFQRAKNLVEAQKERLQRAHQLADKVADRIKQLKAEGKDTAQLEQALDAFQQALTQAGNQHDAAVDEINRHQGFNGDGKVTDAALARDTLKNVRTHLKDAHKTLHDGLVDLRNAIKSYRQSHKPTPTPQP